MKFNIWIDVFVSEKDLNREHIFEVMGPSGSNLIPLQCLIDCMKEAGPAEQALIKDRIVRIDFQNGDVMDFFEHLCGAIAA